MSLARDFLKVAEDLCPTGRGRPPHAQIRRCISTAYYAVFHGLSDEVARPYRNSVQTAARRLLDHGQARDVASALMRGSSVPWLVGQPACDPQLLHFVDDFVFLLLARHRADYDLAYTPTKSDATTAINRARRALDSLDAARTKCPEQLQAMCIAMVATPAARKRMAP